VIGFGDEACAWQAWLDVRTSDDKMKNESTTRARLSFIMRFCVMNTWNMLATVTSFRNLYEEDKEAIKFTRQRRAL
jgi:mRNA deadenylase 3'-5' endonuclease subunit Ccr4